MPSFHVIACSWQPLRFSAMNILLDVNKVWIFAFLFRIAFVFYTNVHILHTFKFLSLTNICLNNFCLWYLTRIFLSNLFLSSQFLPINLFRNKSLPINTVRNNFAETYLPTWFALIIFYISFFFFVHSKAFFCFHSHILSICDDNQLSYVMMTQLN